MTVGRSSKVAMAGQPPGGEPASRERAARARRTVLALAVLAGLFYFGFILMMGWR